MASTKQRRRILVVEDEGDLLQLLKYNLEKQGWEVLSAESGASGLDALRRDKPDIVVLDLMLPDMDGFEFCKTTRKDNNTPILVLTAAKSDIVRKTSIKVGANGFMTKPFSIEAVLERIDAILAEARAS